MFYVSVCSASFALNFSNLSLFIFFTPREKNPDLSVPEVRTVLKHLQHHRDWTAEEIIWWSQ